MNHKSKFKSYVGAVLAAAMLLLSVAPKSNADSFNITNTIYGAVSLISYPNCASTNNLGCAIRVENTAGTFQGFYVKATPASNAANTTLALQLVRSPNLNPPASAADWETVSTVTITAPISTAAGTQTSWVTNLPEQFTCAGYWIGCYVATNGTTNSMTLTNVDVGIVKKYQVQRFP